VIAPLTALGSLLVAAVAAAAPFPSGTAGAICGAKTIPFQQGALASAKDFVWVACRDGHRLIRVDASNGARSRTVALSGFRPWAVASGFGALWAIDRDEGAVWKVNPASGRRTSRIRVPGLPAAIWAGAGFVWIGFENGGRIARITPKTGRVKLLQAGDGVSAFATDGRHVFVVSHRDNAITSVNVASGRSTRLAQELVPTASSATESVAYGAGSLWITGRGTDLLRVNPATGKIEATIDVGPAGLRVVAAGARVIAAAYTDEGARRGDPIVAALDVIDPTTNTIAASATASRTSYLSGLVVRGNTLWAADTVNGVLTRLPVPS